MDCIFCHLRQLILAETELSCAVLDGYPVSRGHTLVVPKRHVASLWEMTTEEYTDAFTLIDIDDAFLPWADAHAVRLDEALGHVFRNVRF
jgi:diadenosine tetraphosphate (Ap4A) HIT family hydrolase